MKLHRVLLDINIEMCILSGIYVWTKIVEMTDVRLKQFSAKLGLMHRPRLLLNDSRIVMKLNAVLNYYFGMCILSGTNIVVNLIVGT